MNGETLYSIGDLARRTGLTVKAIRFYADTGIVPPTDRTPAGYRRYGADAIARIELVRTRRELGLDLATIRKVMDREASLTDVAATHAEALDVQIRVLRQRRAVLTAVARRGSTPQELGLMHKLACLSEAERQCLVDDFLGAVFDGLHDHPAFAAVTRSLTPELPDDPQPEQIEAWVELAELSQNEEFRSTLHGMAQDLAADRATDDVTGLPRILAEAVRAQVTPALEAGVEPHSAEAEPIVTALVAHYARILGSPASHDPHAIYRRLAARLEQMNDPRRDRYLCLLAVINNWPAPGSLEPALTWTAQALRTRIPQR
ncbi:MerR family transcriptional regulator [Streptomyces sp. NRRL S-920]|uniref:MerR family transcriptional regulator n=1 Tax=Streptomyces sp. NRRL S-920 TaxID=1463921 RepID=UPI0004C5C48C|nr:MerR family transcriptional regulator [Streptomyces sp. NRRL S-920]